MHKFSKKIFYNCKLIKFQIVNKRTIVSLETFPLEQPLNEPILEYLKDSEERNQLCETLKKMSSTVEHIPIVIGDEEIYSSGQCQQQNMPHNHCGVIANYSHANRSQLQKAAKLAVEVQTKWDRTLFSERVSIWMKAAELMQTKYRYELIAATMLGQSKTLYQAEIDAACELIDFTKMNTYYLQELMKWQPNSPSPQNEKNCIHYRGIEGFVAAISPFNFTAIAGNLAYTPALCGNSVLWKPSDTSMLSNWIIFKIFREAGLPPGVVNFLPSDGPSVFGNFLNSSRNLAGINFTGSVSTFRRLWRQIGENIDIFNNYPRLVGECGGKNFHFVHSSADMCTVIAATIRSAFEYCGQKCSACSKLYVPESMWSTMKSYLLTNRDTLVVGDVCELQSFMGAVIDQRAYERIADTIEYAKQSKISEILGGGDYNCTKGFFIEPTIIEVCDPNDEILMKNEIFGPILSVYVYKDTDLEKTMNSLLDSNKNRFALTGSIFAQDEEFLNCSLERFRNVAGNLYLNDKSTGAVVGQQPFGGGRLSGTNDKAGGPYYCLRWLSPQTIKQTFIKLNEINYPYMLVDEAHKIN